MTDAMFFLTFHQSICCHDFSRGSRGHHSRNQMTFLRKRLSPNSLALSRPSISSRFDGGEADNWLRMWWPFQWLVIYVLGGFTFVPLVIIGAISESTISHRTDFRLCYALWLGTHRR